MSLNVRSFRMPGGWVRWVIGGAGRSWVAASVAVAGFVFLSLSTTPARAVDFSLNFQPNQPPGWPTTTGVCTFASATCTSSIFGNGDPTPFSQTLTNIGGVTYFHTIVGDPASGFAIESYTQWAPGPNANSATNPTDLSVGDFSPTSGGNARSVIGNSSTTNGSTSNPSNSFMQNNTNLGNPLALSQFSGNGTGDPTKMVFRMVMTSAKGDMSMEVTKPFLDKKPLISQTVQSGTMSSSFVADMTALSYSDKNTPATVTNSLVINDPTLPAGSGANFDMSLAQHPDVTAGRYTYTPGTGWNTTSGWDVDNSTFDPGSYSYFEGGGFNPLTFDWTTNFNYNENALACSRPATTGVTRNSSMGGLTGANCPGHP